MTLLPHPPVRRLVAIASTLVATTFGVGAATAAAADTNPPSAHTPDSRRPGPPSDEALRSPTPGFVLKKGRFTAFEVPDASIETLPYDINERGEIVGRFFDGTSEQAFMRDRAGRFTTIRIPGARAAWASGINNRGQVVGIYSENTPNVKDPNAKQHGFLWEHGTVTRIDFPGAVSTGVFGINDRGHLVGGYVDDTGHGFVWRKGRFRTIDPPAAVTASAYAINNRGQVVGVYADDPTSEKTHGFLLDDGGYTALDAPGVPATVPSGINNRGQISGFTLSPTDADPVAGARGFLLAEGAGGRSPHRVPRRAADLRDRPQRRRPDRRTLRERRSPPPLRHSFSRRCGPARRSRRTVGRVHGPPRGSRRPAPGRRSRRLPGCGGRRRRRACRGGGTTRARTAGRRPS